MEAAVAQETIAKEIRTTVRHTAVYGMGTILAKALSFFMVPVYTHYLSPVDYGVLEILDLSMSLVGMFLNMGITAALLRSYAAAKSVQDRQKVVSSAFVFVAVTGVLTFLVGYRLVKPVSAMLFGAQVPAKYLLLSFSSFVVGYIANLPRTYLRALGASGAFVMVDTGNLFLLLCLNIYFIVVLQLGLVGILLSALIALSLQAVVSTVWTLHKVGFGFSMPLLREMMAFGLPLIVSNLSLFVLNFSDRFFLQHFRSLDEVGIYAVGYKFGYMVNYLVVQPFFIMWQSRLYVIHAQPDHVKIFRQIFALYGAVLTLSGLAMAMLSPDIVRVMVDAKFRSSRDVIAIVAAAYVVWGVGYCAQAGMFLANRTGLVGAIGAGAAAVNIALNYFCISHFGMIGAAWATLLSFIVMTVGSYWCSQRVMPMPLGMGRILVMIALAAVLFAISRLAQFGSLGSALLMKVALLALFPLVLWKARILSPAEIQTVAAAKSAALARVLGILGLDSKKALSL